MSIFQKKDKNDEDFNREISELKKEIESLKYELQKSKEVRSPINNYTPDSYLFHSVFEEAGIAMVILDKNATIVKFNKAFQSFFDYTENELYQKSYFDLIPENRKENTQKSISSLFKLESSNYQTEQVYIKKDNSLAYIKITATILKSKNEIPEYILAVGEDISNFKRQEILKDVVYKISNAVNYSGNLYKLIKAIKENLKSIIDSNLFFIALYNNIDKSFSIPFVKDNKETFETFSAEKTLAGYVQRNKKSVLLNYKDILRLQKESEIFIAGKLSKQWLGVPLMSDDNAIGVIGIHSYDDENAFDENDLTVLEILSNQITTSIQKMRSEDALRIERAYFKELFENSPEAVVIVDNLGIIINVNNEFTNLFGYTKQEAIHSIIEDLISPPDLKDEAQNLTSEIAKGKIIKTNAKRKKKDGSLVDVSVWGTPIILDEGQIAIFAIFRDISDLIENEQKLKEAKEKAEESDKLKTAFLTNMSHEIRTPMNAIVGFAELIGEPSIDDKTKKEFIEQIHASSNTLIKLIEDIIDVSEIDAGKLKISKTKVNISNILNEINDEYNSVKNRENKTNVEILLHNPFGNRIVYINSDEYRLKQIISHLLNNALKYTDNGFIEFGFDIDQCEKPIFYVRDTGIGIPENKKVMIFKHFNKIEDKAKLYRGTGIGLTITKKLVNLLDGKIWVESNLGIGSIFYFSLPERVTLLEIQNNSKMLFKNYNWIGKRILIAEDEDSNYEVLKASLSRTKATITRVSRGDEAINKCMEEDFDVVLMDVKMPVLDGIKATQKIKTFKPNLPIIAQTAYVLKNERDTCIEAGCDDYIPKPIKSFVLLEMINKFFVKAI